MRFATQALLLAALFGVPRGAAAELYSWVDKEGVIHFTNIAPGQKALAPASTDKGNTFDWADGLGAMRKLHRVDVATYDTVIVEAARYYSLPPALVKAVVATESAFEPKAVSSAGAQGLMQLMPQTASRLHVSDSFEPRANIFGGARYLRLMANRFAGDVRLTAAAYNAGPRAVERAGGVPSFEETQTYVRRVLKLYHHYLEHWSNEQP